MKKKLFTILVCMVVIFGVCGCSQSTKKQASKETISSTTMLLFSQKTQRTLSLAGFLFLFSIKGSIPLLGSSPLGKFIVLIFSKRDQSAAGAAFRTLNFIATLW